MNERQNGTGRVALGCVGRATGVGGRWRWPRFYKPASFDSTSRGPTVVPQIKWDGSLPDGQESTHSRGDTANSRAWRGGVSESSYISKGLRVFLHTSGVSRDGLQVAERGTLHTLAARIERRVANNEESFQKRRVRRSASRFEKFGGLRICEGHGWTGNNTPGRGNGTGGDRGELCRGRNRLMAESWRRVEL